MTGYRSAKSLDRSLVFRWATTQIYSHIVLAPCVPTISVRGTKTLVIHKSTSTIVLSRIKSLHRDRNTVRYDEYSNTVHKGYEKKLEKFNFFLNLSSLDCNTVLITRLPRGVRKIPIFLLRRIVGQGCVQKRALLTFREISMV